MSVAAVQAGWIDRDAIGEIRLLPEDNDKGILENGDVLIVEGNGSLSHIGRTALWTLDLPGARHQNHIIRARGGLASSPFIHRWLASPSGRNALVQRATSAAGLYTLSLSKVASLPVPVPGTNEQRRIVDKLDALFAHSKKAKESLDRIPALLEKLKRSILGAAFRGDLTKDWREAHPDVEPADTLLVRIRAERRRRWEEAELARLTARGKVPTDDRWKERYTEARGVSSSALPALPDGWRWVSLDELSWDASYGTSLKCGYEGEGRPVIRIPNIRGGGLVFDDVKRVMDGEVSDEPVAPGDLLIIRTNGSRDLIGRAGLCEDLLEDPTHFASYLIRFRLLGDIHLQRWVSSIWDAEDLRAQIEGNASSSAGQYNVSMTELRALPIPLPPQLEQVSLVDNLRRAVAVVSGLSARQNIARARVEALNAAILSKAFRGELVPQDPTDEPASVLLDRIRAAREAASAEPDEAKPKRPRARRAAARDDTSAPAVSASTMPAEAAASSTEATSTPAAGAPHPFQPTLFPTTATPFLDLPRPAQLPLVHDALRGLGALTTDDAIRRVADHLRTHGHTEFMRLRSDGPLYAALDKAIDAAVREGLVDRPRRGHVRAIVPDAKHYTDADWARCLEAARAEHAATSNAPLDEDALIRAAADWAVENMGLDHQRLRTGGTVHQGLTRALAASKPSG